MKTAMRRAVVVAALLLLVSSLPAAATKFRVQLTNGTEISTLYLPKEASWDTNMLIVLTNAGNWMAVSKDDVAQIVSTIQQQGFGKVLDNFTIQIGLSVNDAPTDEELEAEQADRTDLDRYLDTLRELGQGRPQQDFSVDQFVNPEDAGGGGIPASYGAPGAPSSRDN